MTDKIYYQDKDVLVTSSMIKIKGFNYQVKNVTSYRAVYGGGSIFTFAPFLIGLAVWAMYIPTGNQWGIGVGLALIVFGIFNVAFGKTLYIITSAEQSRGYTVYSKQRMTALMAAIDQAMADNR